MYDNGLLKYYREKAYKDGFLDSKDLPMQQLKTFGRMGIYEISGSRYYTKRVRDVNPKRGIDPEILLGQVYSRLGLTSAIYLPISYSGVNEIISDDIVKDSSIKQAGDFLDSAVSDEERYQLHFLHPKSSIDISKYFTLNALIKQTKLRVVDIASYNSDRHDQNYYYKVLSHWNQTPQSSIHSQSVPKKISKNYTGDELAGLQPIYSIQQKADDVISIDYDISGFNSFRRMNLTSEELEVKNREGCFFDTDFSEATLTRQEVLREIRENELFANLMDKQELAEEIGSVSPIAVARDIKDTIDYEIEPKFAEFLEKSFEEVAETLAQ